MSNANPVLLAKNISKCYWQGSNKIDVFSNLNVCINPQEVWALIGPSGSGKTSLLNILGLLDAPNSGEVYINGINTTSLNDSQKTTLRGNNIGFVFQFHHLLPDFSALENVVISQLIQGVEKKQAVDVARSILGELGLEKRINHFPSMLSGGEQQRVAIARAIAYKPKLLIADEPTGNLDAKTAKDVFALLLDVVEKHGISIIIATHSLEISSKISNKIQL
jgi:lipoprotein-releasing system ATP-binding protein